MALGSRRDVPPASSSCLWYEWHSLRWIFFEAGKGDMILACTDDTEILPPPAPEPLLAHSSPWCRPDSPLTHLRCQICSPHRRRWRARGLPAPALLWCAEWWSGCGIKSPSLTPVQGVRIGLNCIGLRWVFVREWVCIYQVIYFIALACLVGINKAYINCISLARPVCSQERMRDWNWGRLISYPPVW